jgi:hypothetical protein
MDPARRSRNRMKRTEGLTADGTDEHGFNADFIRVDPWYPWLDRFGTD